MPPDEQPTEDNARREYKPEDGGQAFPRPYIKGMSLRDYFAAHGAHHLPDCAHEELWDWCRETTNDLHEAIRAWDRYFSKRDFRNADAMLVARHADDSCPHTP